MKQVKARYQQGSIRKEQRQNGFVWKVRFSDWKDGKRYQRTLTFETTANIYGKTLPEEMRMANSPS